MSVKPMFVAAILPCASCKNSRSVVYGPKKVIVKCKQGHVAKLAADRSGCDQYKNIGEGPS